MADDPKSDPKPDPVAIVALPTIPRTTTRDELWRLARKFDTHAELDARELGEIKAQVAGLDGKLDTKTDRQTLILGIVVALVGAIATIAAALISR